MSGERHDPHPAPRRARVDTWEAALGIAGAPLLWAAQLTAGSAYGGAGCFTDGGRLTDGAISLVPPIIVSAVALVLSLAIAAMAWRLVRRTCGEKGEDPEAMLDTGHGRTHFMARFAVLLSLGFSLAILVNLISMLGTPPCG